jgi:hypothetical protein
MMHLAQHYGTTSDFVALLQGHGLRGRPCEINRRVAAAAKFGYAGVGGSTFRHKGNPGSGLVIPASWGKYKRILVRNTSVCWTGDVCRGMRLPGQVCEGDKRGIYGGQSIVSKTNIHLRARELYLALAGCYESR